MRAHTMPLRITTAADKDEDEVNCSPTASEASVPRPWHLLTNEAFGLRAGVGAENSVTRLNSTFRGSTHSITARAGPA